MAAQSQGIRQLMAAEKEAATTVANARRSKLCISCSVFVSDYACNQKVTIFISLKRFSC